MEPDSRLPCSQEPATEPYIEPDESNPHPPTLFPKDPFLYYPPIYALVFRVASSLQDFKPKYCIHFLSTPERKIIRSTGSFDRPLWQKNLDEARQKLSFRNEMFSKNSRIHSSRQQQNEISELKMDSLEEKL
jgi:hypothetical protein